MGLGCVVRCVQGSNLCREALEVSRAAAVKVQPPLQESEELVSNIVHLAPAEGYESQVSQVTIFILAIHYLFRRGPNIVSEA